MRGEIGFGGWVLIIMFSFMFLALIVAVISTSFNTTNQGTLVSYTKDCFMWCSSVVTYLNGGYTSWIWSDVDTTILKPNMICTTTTKRRTLVNASCSQNVTLNININK